MQLRISKGFAISLLVLTITKAQAKSHVPEPSFKSPITWPGMEPFAFGCLIETATGLKQAPYTCEVMGGKNPDNLDSIGPEVPADKIKLVSPDIADAAFTWEKMHLQEVSFTLTKKMSKKQILSFLGISKLIKPRPNVELVKFNDCAGKTCVLIQNKKRL